MYYLQQRLLPFNRFRCFLLLECPTTNSKCPRKKKISMYGTIEMIQNTLVINTRFLLPFATASILLSPTPCDSLSGKVTSYLVGIIKELINATLRGYLPGINQQQLGVPIESRDSCWCFCAGIFSKANWFRRSHKHIWMNRWEKKTHG